MESWLLPKSMSYTLLAERMKPGIAVIFQPDTEGRIRGDVVRLVKTWRGRECAVIRVTWMDPRLRGIYKNSPPDLMLCLSQMFDDETAKPMPLYPMAVLHDELLTEAIPDLVEEGDVEMHGKSDVWPEGARHPSGAYI